jgi:hypothetical protein
MLMLPSTTCKIYNEINYINSATKMKIHYMVQQMPCECTRNHSIIFFVYPQYYSINYSLPIYYYKHVQNITWCIY